MNHGSLFSGLGGFDLAAEWMGWNNIFQVEIDPFCAKVLEKNFPNTQKYEDIKKFPATNYIGRVDIITGGFPCQPFSQAGKRRGKNDDRHLWPEMLRITSIIKPTWVVAENVRGLLTIEQGVVFEQVCTDLEGEGYEVQPFIIPACAVNAPHRRDRIWFIAYNRGARLEKAGAEQQTKGSWGFNKDASNSKRQGYEREEYQKGQGSRYNSWLEQWARNWTEVAAELCSVDDGLPVELGKFKRSKAGHRNEQIKAYGNAIVPQVAYEIFKSLPPPHEQPTPTRRKV